MDRKEVLKRIQKLQKIQESAVDDGIRNIRALDFLASLLKKTSWTLCSEEPPEEETFVLATMKNKEVRELFYWKDVGSYGSWQSCEDGVGIDSDDAIAWMPLPAPYKSE